MGQASMNTFNHAADIYLTLLVTATLSSSLFQHDLNITQSLLWNTKGRLNLMRRHSDAAETFQTSAWCNITDECPLSLWAGRNVTFFKENTLMTHLSCIKIPTGLSLYVYRIQYRKKNIYIIEETQITLRAVQMEIFDQHINNKRNQISNLNTPRI